MPARRALGFVEGRLFRSPTQLLLAAALEHASLGEFGGQGGEKQLACEALSLKAIKGRKASLNNLHQPE